MKITIPVVPRSKKNSQRIIINPRTKRPMIIQSKLYTNFERECGLYLKKYKLVNFCVIIILGGRYEKIYM